MNHKHLLLLGALACGQLSVSASDNIEYSTAIPKAEDVVSRRDCSQFASDDYSGIRSLRKRLANKNWDGISGDVNGGLGGNAGGGIADGSAPYNNELIDSIDGKGRSLMTAPVYFFFSLGTADLTDDSQLQNIEVLAWCAKKYKLKVYIEGAADSATGTSDINKKLSESRADFIKTELTRRGVSAEKIIISSRGGIERFSPIQRNRYSRVQLKK